MHASCRRMLTRRSRTADDINDIVNDNMYYIASQISRLCSYALSWHFYVAHRSVENLGNFDSLGFYHSTGL